MDNSRRRASPPASGKGADPPGAAASTSAAASEATVVSPSEVDDELFRMGFPRAVAARALRRSDGTVVDGVLDWLAERAEREEGGEKKIGVPASEDATGGSSSVKEPAAASASVAATPNATAEERVDAKVAPPAAGSVARAVCPSEGVAPRKTKPVLSFAIEEPPFSSEPPVRLSATRPAKKSRPAVEPIPPTDTSSLWWEAGVDGREMYGASLLGPGRSSSGERVEAGAGAGDGAVVAGTFGRGAPATRLAPSLEGRTGQGPLGRQEAQQPIGRGASNRAGIGSDNADTVMTPVAHAVVVEGDEEERGASASGAGSVVLASATPAPPAVRTRWMKIGLALLAAGLAAMGVAFGLSSRGENGKAAAVSSKGGAVLPEVTLMPSTTPQLLLTTSADQSNVAEGGSTSAPPMTTPSPSPHATLRPGMSSSTAQATSTPSSTTTSSTTSTTSTPTTTTSTSTPTSTTTATTTTTTTASSPTSTSAATTTTTSSATATATTTKTTSTTTSTTKTTTTSTNSCANGGCTWTPVPGAAWYGDNDGDKVGTSTALSADGSTLVVGGRGSGSPGCVKVYRESNDTTGVWTQLGPKLAGSEPFDRFGISVDVSASGRRMVLGADGTDYFGMNVGVVRVYQLNDAGTNFHQIGEMQGDDSYDQAGWTVSMSGDGNVVAYGASEKYTRVYRWNGNRWNSVGDRINFSSRSGRTLALSYDGTTMALGHIENSGVRVYSFSGNGWSPKGTDILRGPDSANAGASVSLSSDGNTLAFGGPLHNFGRGMVRAYQFEGNSWDRIGNNDDLAGAQSGAAFGTAVALNDDGTILAVGAPGNATKGLTALDPTKDGVVDIPWKVTVYQRSSSSDTSGWTSMGSITGDVYAYGVSRSEPNLSLSLNGKGRTLAVGSAVNGEEGTDRGKVTVYRYG